MNFNEIPLYPSAHWEVNIGFRELKQHLRRHLEDPSLPLDLDPDFQRGHVWTMEQRTSYIEYLLRGGEHGKTIVCNCPGWPVGPGPYQLLDGKQRLESALLFLDGRVPAFGKTFPEFTGRMRFFVGFKWRILALPDRAACLRYYLDMNTGGTPHSEGDREGAATPGGGT